MRWATLLAAASAAAVLWAAGAGANHTKYYWAGSWTTNVGVIAWRVMNAQDVQTAKTASDRTVLFNRLACGAGATYYRGGYQSGGDKGKIMGCATGNQKHMLGRFVSNLNGISGSVDLTIVGTAPPRYSGTFKEDRAGGSSGAYSGTWKSHFSGDNATGAGAGAGSSDFRWTVKYFLRGATTKPPNCAATPGTVSGHGNANVIGGEIRGGGLSDQETPNLARCRVDGLTLQILDSTLAVKAVPGGEARTVTAHVLVTGPRGTDCPNGAIGTLTLTDSDQFLRPQGLYADSFSLGGWNKPCKGHRHTWSQTSPGSVAITGSNNGKGSAAFAQVICVNPEGNGLASRYC